MNPKFIGDCRDEELVTDLFGSVTDLARLIEERGNKFTYVGITVEYDDDTDIHSFYAN